MSFSASARRLGASVALGLASVTVGASTIHAQAALDAKSAEHLRNSYLADLDTVHSKILQLAEAIPADKYAWRPSAGVRSVSEVLMHVSGEWYYYTPMSVAGKAPNDFGVPREKLPALEKVTDKDAVLSQLRSSWAYCESQLKGVDPANLTGTYKPWGQTLDVAAFGMAGDLHEHLGQLIAYARSVGVAPPWSK